MKHDLKISLRKPSYPVNDALKAYLQKFNRTIRLPIFYDDLLRFSLFGGFHERTLKRFHQFSAKDLDLIHVVDTSCW